MAHIEIIPILTTLACVTSVLDQNNRLRHHIVSVRIEDQTGHNRLLSIFAAPTVDVSTLKEEKTYVFHVTPVYRFNRVEFDLVEASGPFYIEANPPTMFRLVRT